jgi:hypothetical protein
LGSSRFPSRGVALGGLQTLKTGAGAAPAALGGLTCARTQVRARPRTGGWWGLTGAPPQRGPRLSPRPRPRLASRRSSVGRRSQPKFSPTRLETRTKESNSCASRRGLRSPKAKRMQRPLLEGADRRSRARTPGRSRGASNGSLFTDGRAHPERTRWDPKDGELCLARAKPGETLVEARLGSDVQIDPQSWV